MRLSLLRPSPLRLLLSLLLLRPPPLLVLQLLPLVLSVLLSLMLSLRPIINPLLRRGRSHNLLPLSALLLLRHDRVLERNEVLVGGGLANTEEIPRVRKRPV